MSFIIKKMEEAEEIRGKAYVHWKSWQEAYAQLLDPEYLSKRTLEECEQMAYKWPDNILVAKDGDRVIGFCAYGKCQDNIMPNAGEIFALYVLKEYYGRDVGQMLMQAGLEQLSCPLVVIWVLKGNKRAIRFYEKCGFRPDGSEKQIILGSPVTEMRMIRNT